MNQILVTKKLYVTPELKKKKKAYKLYFILSVFLIFILISFYIYAEYDRTKGEEASADLLNDFNQETADNKKDVLVAILSDDGDGVSASDDGTDNSSGTGSNSSTGRSNSKNKNQKQKSAGGYTYTTVAKINIPKINVQYSIIDGETDSVEETEELLKISPTKFWGPDPNTVGNFCVVGHNYRNTKFFSKVPTLENGDIIEITDNNNKTLRYGVYKKYEVIPDDISCLDQDTNGKKEVTLITCTNDSKMRVIVKARAL